MKNVWHSRHSWEIAFFQKKSDGSAWAVVCCVFVICSDFLEFFIYPLAYNNQSLKTWFNCQIIRGVGSTPAGLMRLILLFFFLPRDNSSPWCLRVGWAAGSTGVCQLTTDCDSASEWHFPPSQQYLRVIWQRGKQRDKTMEWKAWKKWRGQSHDEIEKLSFIKEALPWYFKCKWWWNSIQVAGDSMTFSVGKWEKSSAWWNTWTFCTM